MRNWGFVAAPFLALIAGCPSAPSASCTPACMSTQTCCDVAGGHTHCQDTLIDTSNCGGCGIACGAGQACQLGHCVAGMDAGPSMDGGHDAAASGNCHPSCASGSMCCGTTCVSATGIATGDARMDPSFTNCHICGASCDATSASRCGLPVGSSSGTPQCLCGNLPPCTMGSVCELSGGSYSCVNHSTDPRHCGDAGVMCGTGEICMDGMCTCSAADGGTGGVCPAGLQCTATGCVDTMNDPMNCGTVGTACRAGESCHMGMCQCGTTGTRCMAGGLMGCGQTCCDGACVYVDDYNCGGCGMACASPMVCGKGLTGPAHCGTDGAPFFITCDAPTDAAPSDGGSVDAATISDAGVDASDDASVDAYVDPG